MVGGKKADRENGGQVGGAKASGTKRSSGKSTPNDDVRREAPLQAIVFADSFAETFRPITLEKPKVLLPLANVPMLEYSLEFLASGGVQEVILFCKDHAEQVEEYIRDSSSSATKRLRVKCVASPTCHTAGDALREIDRLGLIQSNPFVLMSGDVVANVNLQQVIEEHKARKKQDPSCMMTSVFKQVPSTYGTNIRPLDDELIVGIDPTSSQIVLYENDAHQRATRVATVFLEEHAQIALRSDLMDCFIDICATEVLLKFAEDFDYQHLRKDFYHNEVQNYELGKKFHVKIVTEEFAARVQDPRTYSGVTRAILQRWVFPMVPDNNYLSSHATTYAYHRGMVYKEQGVFLARTCSVQRESIIGAGTSCGDYTQITSSAIGRHCVLGKNVVIEDSIVWGNVTIEDDVTIRGAILCDNVTIRAGAVIEEGCVLSYGVVVGPKMHLRPCSKLTTVQRVEEDDGFSSDDEASDELRVNRSSEAPASTALRRHGSSGSITWDRDVVGEGGSGRLWTFDDDNIEVDSDEDEEGEGPEQMERRRFAVLQGMLPGGEAVVHQRSHKWDEWETLSSDEDDDGEDEDDLIAGLPVEGHFHHVIYEMVSAGDQAGHQVDDTFVEIMSFKFAQNKTFPDVIGAMVPALLELVPIAEGSAMVMLANVRAKFLKWSNVLRRCLVEHADQMAVIEALETACGQVEEERKMGMWAPLFRFLLQIVYDLEWVTEEQILTWHQMRVADPTRSPNFAQAEDVQAFIDWLKEDDDEEDEEDEEDDEEED